MSSKNPAITFGSEMPAVTRLLSSLRLLTGDIPKTQISKIQAVWRHQDMMALVTVNAVYLVGVRSGRRNLTSHNGWELKLFTFLATVPKTPLLKLEDVKVLEELLKANLALIDATRHVNDVHHSLERLHVHLPDTVVRGMQKRTETLRAQRKKLIEALSTFISTDDSDTIWD